MLLTFLRPLSVEVLRTYTAPVKSNPPINHPNPVGYHLLNCITWSGLNEKHFLPRSKLTLLPIWLSPRPNWRLFALLSLLLRFCCPTTSPKIDEGPFPLPVISLLLCCCWWCGWWWLWLASLVLLARNWIGLMSAAGFESSAISWNFLSNSFSGENCCSFSEKNNVLHETLPR